MVENTALERKKGSVRDLWDSVSLRPAEDTAFTMSLAETNFCVNCSRYDFEETRAL